ncbi:hypothetical protein SAMN05216178_6949 [Pseudomonas saponiphila]|jgi:hypothetical protein|uniref:Uncharacterized protein n=1 Tax=Pseudomonas saponiphila TaxID=556534 RepID=A0A1H5A3P3_9PSED|nr:hypothetical protein [Pseudomonas saponiphila]SED36394.1 hypothetical protein SAMN05216178_6949 [Pseudomonas saponiphila]
MNAFETSLWAARKTARQAALSFDGILSDAFVMRAAVGHAYDVEGYAPGEWIRTAEVTKTGSLINYDFIETADGKRYLIHRHECPDAKRSFEHIGRVIAVNSTLSGQSPSLAAQA